MSASKVMKLVARPVRREVFAKDPEAVSLGDRSVFSHALFDGDTEVGFDGGVCTVVRNEAGEAYIVCNVSMFLPEGTISFQTFMREEFPPPPFYTAILGGTGAYRGARGEMHIDPASPDTHYYTLHLETADD